MRKPFCVSINLGMALLALAAAGCGGSAFPTATVNGRVVYQGQGVGNASVLFSPQSAAGTLPGKSAVGTTDADGNFVLSTYKMGDGAVVGKHQVHVTRHVRRRFGFQTARRGPSSAHP